jgi:asparagine synthase (glutamine-hydrolysing)
MCGIAGFLTRRPGEADVAGLARALERLAHRGPDDGGSVLFPAVPDRGPLVGLGNRRLSIIDTSSAGHQPMTTADGRFSITYNGEIYNAPELRAELEASGRRFVSHCDTEVLLQAWAAWGRSTLVRLEGMFAFAVLDRVERRLVLVRDPFGIKPLFYSHGDGRVVFASEIPAILAFGGVGRRINAGRLREYLVEAHTGNGAETLLADVRQVPPAHYLEVGLDAEADDEPTRYWEPDGGKRCDVPFAAAAEELRALVLDSVRLHLRSDVPVAFSLSGGTDSSSVLLAARRVLGPATELAAFGFVADDPAISEAAWQTRAASAASATLHAVHVSAADIARDLDRTVDAQGEPFGSPAIYAQYRVFAAARAAGITVILGGQGSDELFAGYDPNVPARAATLLMQLRWLTALRFAATGASRSHLARRDVLRRAAVLAMPRRLEHLLRSATGRVALNGVPAWLDRSWFADQGVAAERPWRPGHGDAMRQLLAHSLYHAHLQALMRYEDRSAMALSMESRVPLLTPRLARFALSLPESHLLAADGEGKAVLRRAMRGIVPDSILDRRDKVGFAVPVARWLAELAPLVDERMALAGTFPVIRPGELALRRAAALERGSIGAAYIVWRCLTLATWVERGALQWT